MDLSAGADISDCTVTFTTDATTLRGTVEDDLSHGAVDADVIVFPVERDQWDALGLSPARLKCLQVRSDGAYQFQSLPAGEYYVIAVSGEASKRFPDPEMFAALTAKATKVRLAWGEVLVENLKGIFRQ
jgi:hypothetical protein